MKAILTYHSIDGSGSPISVAPDVFRRHMAWLAKGPVRVLPLDELVATESGTHAVALTFDDGFVNLASEAAQVLAEFELPATVFVVSDHVGGDNRWGGVAETGIPTLPLLDWDALGRLAESGVELGNHTRSHPDLSELAPDDVREELETAHQAIMTQTGVRARSVAYPYGSHNGEVTSVAAELYPMAVTTDLRTFGPSESAMRLPRLDMYYYQSQGQLEAWGSRRFEQRLWFRRQARLLRKTLSPTGGVS